MDIESLSNVTAAHAFVEDDSGLFRTINETLQKENLIKELERIFSGTLKTEKLKALRLSV